MIDEYQWRSRYSYCLKIMHEKFWYAQDTQLNDKLTASHTKK